MEKVAHLKTDREWSSGEDTRTIPGKIKLVLP